MAADEGDVIRYDDFIDPQTGPAIKELSDNFKMLDGVFTATSQSIQKQAKQSAAELRQLAEANLEVARSLTTGSEQQKQALQGVSKETTRLITEQQKQAAQQKGFADALKQTEKQISDLEKQVNRLAEANAKITSSDAEAIRTKKELALQAQQLKNEQLALTNALLEQKKASDAIIQANKQEEAASKAATAAIREKNAAVKQAGSSAPVVNGGSNIGLLNDEVAATAAATGTVVSQLEQQEAQATITAIEWAAAQQAAGATAAQITPAIEAEITAIQQLSQSLVSTQAELTTVNLELKSLEKAYRSGAVSEEQFITQTAALKVQQQQLSIALGSVRKELAQEVAAADGAVGAYELLNREYLIAKKNAYDLAAAEGVQSKAAIEAAATAAALNSTLKQIDETVGNNQRKVGGYAEGFSKAFGAIRQAAYILPGIGIAGIFNLIYEGASKLITELFKTVPAFDAAKQALRGYVQVVESAQKNSEQEIINLKIQQKVIADTSLSMDVRLQAVKNIKEEYPAYLKNVSDEALLSGQAAAQVDLLSKALFQKAYAEAASNKAAELGIKTLELQGKARFLVLEQSKAQIELQNQQSRADATVGTGGSTAVGLGSGAYNSQLLSAQGHLEDINKQLNDNRLQQRGNNVEIQRYIDEAGKFGGVVEELKKGKSNFSAQTDNFKSFLAQLIKAQQDGLDIELQAEIKFRQAIADSDKFGYQERANEQKKASALRLQLITESRDAELSENRAKEDEALRQYNNAEAKANADTKLKISQRNEIIGQAATERNIAEAAFQQERANIIAKADLAIQQEQVTTAAAVGAIRKQQHDAQIAELKQFAKEMQDAQAAQFAGVQANTNQAQIDFDRQRTELYVADLKRLNDKYRSGEIKSIEEFNKRKKSLDDEFAHASLANQVEFTQATINNLKTVPNLTKEQNDIILKLEDDLAKGKKALYDDDVKAFQEAEKIKQEAIKQREDIEQASYELAGNLVNGLNQLYQAQSDDQIARLEKQKEDELSIAGENAAAKDAINKKYAKLEADQKRKAAIADKIAALFQIGINTAEAVSKAVAASPTTFGLPFSAFAIATGVLQAAIVAAKPIPSYFKGRRAGGPEEWALVGEQGTEAIEHAHGGVTLTRSGAHFRHLEAGDKVYQTGSAETNYYKRVAEFNSTKVYDNITNNVIESKRAADMQTMAAAMASQPFAGLTQRGLAEELKNRPVREWHITERGIEAYERNRLARVKSMNKRQGFGDEGS